MHSDVTPDTGDSTPQDKAALFLARILSNGALPVAALAEAGDTLAALGDPCFAAERLHLPNDPALGFISIPARAFNISDGNGFRIALKSAANLAALNSEI